jgi:hypothetical protein
MLRRSEAAEKHRGDAEYAEAIVDISIHTDWTCADDVSEISRSI